MTPADDNGSVDQAADGRQTLITAFTEAIADSETAARLGGTGTSVRLEFGDRPEDSITLLLDRDPPELIEGDDATVAESTLCIDADVLAGVLDRKVRLSVAIVDGRVTYEGPIRRFLRVMPIIVAAANHEHFGHSLKEEL